MYKQLMTMGYVKRNIVALGSILLLGATVITAFWLYVTWTPLP